MTDFGDRVDHDVEALLDGCDGDSEGLRKALGDAYTVVHSSGDEYGWGHHSYNTVYRATDGRTIHADCGGCSCGGSGNWDYATEGEAMRMIPEDQRE